MNTSIIRKILSIIVPLIIFYAIVVNFGAYFFPQNTVSPPPVTTSTIPADWKIFQNDKYGFAISLPPNYELSGPKSGDQSEYFYIGNPEYVPDYYLTVYQAGSEKNYWYGAGFISEETIVINGIPSRKIVFKTIDPGGKEGQCPFYEFRTSQYTYTFTGYEQCFEGELALSILNTFKFTSSQNTQTNSTLPVIDSIAPTSGPVGTVIEIRGKNFNGLENDLYIHMENLEGKQTAVYVGNNVTGDDSFTYMKLQIPPGVCSEYPDKSCFYITPGVYKVYTYGYPNGEKSNVVEFIVTAQ